MWSLNPGTGVFVRRGKFEHGDTDTKRGGEWTACFRGRDWSDTAGNARAASNHQKPGGGIDQKFPRAFGRSLALLIP